MPSHKVQSLNELNFDAVVSETTGPMLVDFTAAWCPPCKVLSAILHRLAEESDHLVIAAVDVDDCPELAARFGIRGMPTLLAFENGRETGRRLGLTNEQGIRALLTGPGTRVTSG